jgi:hypothetical protein
MTIELPTEIARYFEADGDRDAAAVSGSFTAGAVVRDEGHTHTGRDAIERWAAGYLAKYDCTTEPFAVAHEGDRTVVTSHVVGKFPGSPVDLRYRFSLADGAIAGLEITL